MSVVQIDATESQPHVKYEHLVAAAKLVPSAVTIVAHPCDEASLRGAAKPPPALAFDNAIDKEAARIKGIKSAVAGQAQILLVPDLEAGNMLAKNLTFMAKADSAGIVLGARVRLRRCEAHGQRRRAGSGRTQDQ